MASDFHPSALTERPGTGTEPPASAPTAAPAGSWRQDLRTGATDWSPDMYAVYGRAGPDSAAAPSDCLATVHPDDVAATEAAFTELVARRAPMNLTHRVRHPDGSVHHVQVLGDLTLDADGRPVSAQGTAQDVTAQRLRETALRSSEAYLRTVFATMSEGLVTHDADGRVIDANDAALAILGLSRDELLGRTSIDPRWRSVREDGSDWPGADHPAMVALRTGEPQRRRIMGVIAPGQGRRWISINATPLRRGAGAPVAGVVATFVDITADIEDRLRLEQSMSELADLYEQAPCGYHSLDADGRFVRINDTELGWLGVTRDEAVGTLGPKDFMTDEGRALFAATFPRLLAGERVAPFEFELVARDGRRRWVRAEVSVLRDARRLFAASRTVLHDITEAHRAQAALAQLSQEQQLMLDSDLFGLVRVKERRFTWVSRGLTAMFGHALEDLLDQPTRILYFDDAEHARVGMLIAASRESARPQHGEFRLRRRDGSEIWLDIGVSPVPGTADEVLGNFTDITAVKQAQEARRQAEALDAENAQLRETDRLKGLFLSNLSHELRTPLNAVIGLAHLLDSGFIKPESPKFHDHLAQIGASGRHLTQLLDTMLGYANLEAKRLALHPEPLDMLAAVQDAVHTFRAGGGTGGASIGITVGEGVHTMVVDPLRLRQVLVSLIDNAVKFSAADARIEVRVVAEGDAHVRIEVQDAGIGIAEADLPRLFAPFVQLSAGSTKTHPGLGMGLALVRRIVQAQDGSVGVHSRLGAGSTFHVILPREPAPPA